MLEMKRIRSITAVLVCASLLLALPGPRAFAAAAAALRNAPAVQPSLGGGLGCSPVLAPAASSLIQGSARTGITLGSVLPGLQDQTLRLSPTSIRPSAKPAARIGVTASPTAVRSLGPEQHSFSPGTQGRSAVSKRTSELAAAVAPIVENLPAAASDPAAARSAGGSLHSLLAAMASRSRPASALAARTHRFGENETPRTDEKGGLAYVRELQIAVRLAPERDPDEVPEPDHKTQFKYYAVGVATTKVGIETLNLVVPILLLTQYGNATLVGTLFIASGLAGMVAAWLSGPLIDKFKPARAMISSAAIQMLAIGAMPLMLAIGVPLGLPMLFSLFILNGAMIGVFDTARRAALPHILGQDEEVLRQHNAKLYILREILSIAAVGGAGFLLGILGHLTTLAIHPAAYLIVLFALLRMSGRMKPSYKAALASEMEEEDAQEYGFKGLLKGAKAVWADKTLLLATLVNIPVITLHRLMHAILAAVYATQVLGNPAMAAVMLMAWNAGELAAAIYLRKHSNKKGSFGWLKYTALVSMTLWALYAFPSIWVAAPAIFLLSTGNMSSELGLTAYFQAAAPKRDVGAVTGFIYSLATAASMAGLLAMGRIFDLVSASGGFLVLAGIMTGMALFYLLAARKLKPLEGAEQFPSLDPE